MLTKFMLTPAGMAFDRFLVRWTGRSLMNELFARAAGIKARPALLLITRGRRSGKDRAVALPWFEQDGKRFVVGSKGGAPQDPHWVTNLRAYPDARIVIDRRTRPVHTRIADGAEHDALWAAATATVPSYAGYQKLTSRRIPLVVIEG